MTLSLISFLSFMLILLPSALASANSSENNLNSLQASFEQKIMSRLQVALESVVGKDLYYINLKVELKQPKIKQEPLYFSKFGISSEPRKEEAFKNLPVEDWISNVSVDVSIAEKLAHLDEAVLKTKLESIIQSQGKFKYDLQISRYAAFTPSEMQGWWTKIPWTPVAIILGGLMLCFSFFGLSSSISRVKLNVSPVDNSLSQMELNEPKNSVAAANQNSVQENTEAGAKKWALILSDDVASAKAFINEIASSSDEKDILVLDYILKNSPLSELKKIILELPSETAKKIYKLAVSITEPYSKASADLYLQNRMHQFLLSQFIDHDQALKQIYDFSTEECIEQIKLQPELLHIFVQQYSSVQIERIFSEIDPALLNQFFSKKDVQTDHKSVITKARESVDNNRRKCLQFSESTTLKVLLAASHIEESRELALFKAAIPELPVKEILHAGQENFPQFLIEDLPPDTIRPVLLSYPMKERANLLLSFDPKKRSRFMSLMGSDGRALEVLEAEIDEISSSPQRMKFVENEGGRLKKDFTARIRKYLKSSSELKSLGTQVLEAWIQNQTGTRHEKSAA